MLLIMVTITLTKSVYSLQFEIGFEKFDHAPISTYLFSLQYFKLYYQTIRYKNGGPEERVS